MVDGTVLQNASWNYMDNLLQNLKCLKVNIKI